MSLFHTVCEYRCVLFIFCNRSLNACRDEEILLFQAQFFTRIVIIIRIEHLNDVLRQVLLFNRFLIITFVEGIQLEGVNRLGIPDAECIYDTVSVASTIGISYGIAITD